MFEQQEDRVDKGRSRAIMIVAGLAMVVVIAGVVYYSSRQAAPQQSAAQTPGLPNAAHAGNPVFDKNVGLVSLVNKKYFTQANMLGQRQAIANGTIVNFTEKPVLGIELRGRVIGADGKEMATVLAMPVPKLYEKIAAKGSIPFTVTIDGVPKEGEIADITIEVEGLVMGE